MANLGTLWFGADIDLTQLKQKIQNGNQSILDALKMNYDPASYQQMVNKLRTELGKETFEIKISANTNKIVQNVQNAAKGGSGNIIGLDKVNDQILRQTALVNDLKAKVAQLKAEYEKLGGTERYNRWKDAGAEVAKEQAALKTLEATRKAYNRATAQSVTTKRQASQAAQQLERDHLRLNATLLGGIHVSTQLGSALSSLFAVDAARQFLNNVIEIGGQLEKQRISMGAIVGDTARANELFENIKNLAVKSPFGVVELDQYSKQLAAFGIEQSDLFGMTKRLADISAGAGQDIGRLALALGHVKSATYLTGITLRQFSMNNIPMLKMLADYYTEVEKRAVSTAEVQKRISKRQVSYEDVIEQIKRMTDEGGQFYNMQEKISESLQAKFKNLRDSFDIMYGEIAESAIGDALKGFATGATAISREWKKVLSVLGEAAVFFGTYRLSILGVNYATYNLNNNTIATALAEGKLSAGMMKRYVQTEKITKAMLLQAVATQKVSAADAELAAAEFGVTRAQLDRVAATGRYTNLLNAGSLATSRYTVHQLRLVAALRAGNLSLFAKGLTGLKLGFSVLTTSAKAAGSAIAGFLKPFAGFAVFSAVIETWMESSRKAEEQEQRLADMAEKANEGFKNLSETRNKFKTGASADMTDDSIALAIPEMVEQLKNYSKTATETFNNAFAINKEGKSVHSLKEQYEILAKAIDDTTEAYRHFNDMRPMVENSIEAAEPDKSWLDKLMLNSVGRALPSEDKAVYMNLKESLEFYAEALGEASKAEQIFLRNHLDIVKVLQSMGVANASEMTNEEVLSKLTEWMTFAPSKFKEFSNLLEGDTAKAFDNVIDKWNTLGTASVVATDRLKKSGEDFYKSMKAQWGEDQTKWAANWKDVVLMAMDEATKGVKGFENMSEEAQNDLRNIWLKPFNIDVNTDEAFTQVNNLLVELENLVGKEWVVQIGIKGMNVVDDLDNANKAYKKALSDLKTLNKSKKTLEDEGRKDTEAYQRVLNNEQNAILARDAAAQIIHQYGGELPEIKNTSSRGGSRKADEQLKRWKEQISLLDKYRQELEKLSKLIGLEEAEAQLKAGGNFSSLFGAFSNPNDYIASLNEMIAKLGKTGERGSFAEQLGAKKGEEELRQFTDGVQSAVDELTRMLGVMQENYNVYKKWVDLTGDHSLAAQIAGVTQNTSFADYIKEEYDKLKGYKGMSAEDFFGLKSTEAIKAGKDSALFKLWELWQQNNKKIKEDNLKLYEDAIKNAKTYEDKIADINRRLEEEIGAIKQLSKNPDEQARLINNATENANKEKADLMWKNFKETEDWGRIFSDLNNITTDTLSYMLDKLREVAPSIRDSVEATKALYEAMDKIQDQLYDRNPFAALGDYFKKMSAFRNAAAGLKGSKGTDKIHFTEETAQKMGLTTNGKGWTGTVQEFFDAMQKAKNSFSKIIGSIGKTFKALQDVLQPVIDLFDQLGMTGLSNVFQAGNNALGTAANIASGMSSLQGLFKDPNKGLGKLLGDAAPWAAAAGAGLSIVSSLFAFHDAALQEEIEASQARQKEMESLTKNLERVLERTLGGFYNVSLDEFDRSQLNERNRHLIAKTFAAESFSKMFGLNIDTKGLRDEIKLLQEALKTNDNYKAQKASLMAQREEIERQMRAEQDKKDSDESAIQGYKDSIQDIDDQIKHFAEDLAKAIYDIDIKSWAQELGDALFDAWQKGEDGAEAFKKKAREIITDVAKNIAVQKLIETALKPVLDIITSEMNRKSGKLDTESIQLLANAMEVVGTTLPDSFNSLMEGIDAGLQKAGLGSMKDDAESDTSNSITSGIKSITENTADPLASYINAMRGDLSLQRTDVYAIRLSLEAMASRQNVIAEAQTEQMRQIAANTYRNADAADAILLILRRATQDKAFGIHVQ